MILREPTKETLKILYSEWPSNFVIELPADLIVTIEGLLDTEEEASECLFKCVSMQGGTMEGHSSNEKIQIILDWYREFLYSDNEENLKKYAEEVRNKRHGPDLQVSSVIKSKV